MATSYMLPPPSSSLIIEGVTDNVTSATEPTPTTPEEDTLAISFVQRRALLEHRQPNFEKEYHGRQHVDFGVLSMYESSTEHIEYDCYGKPLVEPLSEDVGGACGLPVPCKRTFSSSTRRGPGLEDAHSAKRHVIDPISTSKSTPPTLPSSEVSNPTAGNKPRYCLSNNDCEDDSVQASMAPIGHGTSNDLSPPPETAQHIPYIVRNLDSYQSEGYTTNNEEDSSADELNYAAGVASATHSRQSELGDRPYRRQRSSLSRAVRGKEHFNKRPTGASPPTVSRQLRRFPRSNSSRVSSTRLADEPEANHEHSVSASYQVSDVTFCPIPEGSSLVVANFKSRTPPNPLALDPNLPGERGHPDGHDITGFMVGDWIPIRQRSIQDRRTWQIDNA